MITKEKHVYLLAVWHTHTFGMCEVPYIVNILCCEWPWYHLHWCNSNFQVTNYTHYLFILGIMQPIVVPYKRHTDTQIKQPWASYGCLLLSLLEQKVTARCWYCTCGGLLKSCNQHAKYSHNRLRWTKRLYFRGTWWRHFNSVLGLGWVKARIAQYGWIYLFKLKFKKVYDIHGVI